MFFMLVQYLYLYFTKEDEMISIKNLLKEAYNFKEKQTQYFREAKNKYLNDIELWV